MHSTKGYQTLAIVPQNLGFREIQSSLVRKSEEYTCIFLRMSDSKTGSQTKKNILDTTAIDEMETQCFCKCRKVTDLHFR